MKRCLILLSFISSLLHAMEVSTSSSVQDMYTTICNASQNAQQAFALFETLSGNISQQQQTFITDAMTLYNNVQQNATSYITKRDLSNLAFLISPTSIQEHAYTTSDEQLKRILSFSDYLNLNDTAFKTMLVRLIDDNYHYPCLSNMYTKYKIFINPEDLAVYLINRELVALRSGKNDYRIKVQGEIPANIKTINEFKEFHRTRRGQIMSTLFGEQNPIPLDDCSINKYKLDTFNIGIVLYSLTIIKQLFDILHVDGNKCQSACISYDNNRIDIDQLMNAMPNMKAILFDKSTFENMYAQKAYSKVMIIRLPQSYFKQNNSSAYRTIFPDAHCQSIHLIASNID